MPIFDIRHQPEKPHPEKPENDLLDAVIALAISSVLFGLLYLLTS